MDTSSISLIDFSTDFENYHILGHESKTFHRDHIAVTWHQAREQLNVQVQINSLDTILGTVGGLASIIWGILQISTGDYYSFILDHKIIRSVYEIHDGAAGVPETSEAAKD